MPEQDPAYAGLRISLGRMAQITRLSLSDRKPSADNDLVGERLDPGKGHPGRADLFPNAEAFPCFLSLCERRERARGMFTG